MTVVNVAVGVILNDANQVLLAQRALNSHQGGLWEFPGGKLEPGECAKDALSRELYEELGLKVSACEHLLDLHHHYCDKSVKLMTYLVRDYIGVPRCLAEQLDLKWFELSELDNLSLPAANIPIVTKLKDKLCHN